MGIVLYAEGPRLQKIPTITTKMPADLLVLKNYPRKSHIVISSQHDTHNAEEVQSNHLVGQNLNKTRTEEVVIIEGTKCENTNSSIQIRSKGALTNLTFHLVQQENLSLHQRHQQATQAKVDTKDAHQSVVERKKQLTFSCLDQRAEMLALHLAKEVWHHLGRTIGVWLPERWTLAEIWTCFVVAWCTSALVFRLWLFGLFLRVRWRLAYCWKCTNVHAWHSLRHRAVLASSNWLMLNLHELATLIQATSHSATCISCVLARGRRFSQQSWKNMWTHRRVQHLLVPAGEYLLSTCFFLFSSSSSSSSASSSSWDKPPPGQYLLLPLR